MPGPAAPPRALSEDDRRRYADSYVASRDAVFKAIGDYERLWQAAPSAEARAKYRRHLLRLVDERLLIEEAHMAFAAGHGRVRPPLDFEVADLRRLARGVREIGATVGRAAAILDVALRAAAFYRGLHDD